MDKQLQLHQNISEELKRLEFSKKQMELILSDLPKGSIFERDGKYYHVFRENGKQRMFLIKEMELLNQLRTRRHIEKALPQIKSRISNCRSFLKKDALYDISEISLDLPERYRSVSCKELWLPGDMSPTEWGRAEY